MIRSYHPLDEHREHLLAALASNSPNTSFQSIYPVSSSHPRQVIDARGSKILQRAPDQGKTLRGALVSVVSLVLILALLAECRRSQERLNSGAAVRRNLSDREDEEERSYIVEQCLALEEALGVRVGASGHGEDASEGQARLVEMLYESAAAFERDRLLAPQGLQDETHIPPHKIARYDEPWPSTSHSQASVGSFWRYSSGVAMGDGVSAFDADAWAREESGLFSGGDEEQRHVTKLYETPGLQQDLSAFWKHVAAFREADASFQLPASLSVGRAGSGEDAMTVDAWVNNPLTSPHPQAVKQRVMDTAWGSPMLAATGRTSSNAGSVAPSNELAVTGGLAIPDAEATQRTAVQVTEREGMQQVEDTAVILDSTLDALEGSVSSTAMRATMGGGGDLCGGVDIRLHPFVRLPVVNPKDIHRRFRKEFVGPTTLRARTPMEAYTAVRRLFAKASLTAEDVEVLMKAAELVANYAMHRLANPCRRRTASHVFIRLSSLFMAFDLLVCTIELLGDAMITSSWWDGFVQMFHTNYVFPEVTKSEKTDMLVQVVKRLSSALSIYKRKKRPAFVEIIELKRQILKYTYKDTHLAHPLWTLWRQDDENFVSSGTNPEGSSGFEKQDAREAKTP
ncbi:hypothetical protein EBH_0056410 [Eimeria brunetti]|uniref:Uncharacterized protein n=1 Tax=Eimeria brunetti TaxID=51314 RepID=U6LXL4_9EIME|nr:hypothetical protein EBH_0056410 [Eimeria brunetti]